MHSLCHYHYSYSFHEPVIPAMGGQWQKLVDINCLHYSVYFMFCAASVVDTYWCSLTCNTNIITLHDTPIGPSKYLNRSPPSTQSGWPGIPPKSKFCSLGRFSPYSCLSRTSQSGVLVKQQSNFGLAYMHWADSLLKQLSLFSPPLAQKRPSMWPGMNSDRDAGKTLIDAVGVWALACTFYLGALALVMPHLRCTTSILWWTPDRSALFYDRVLVDMTKPNAWLALQAMWSENYQAQQFNKESWLFIIWPYSASWSSDFFFFN